MQTRSRMHSQECPCCCLEISDTRSLAICECGFSTCDNCLKTYLINSTSDADCMSCHRHFDQDFLCDILGSGWVNGAYKKHTSKVMRHKEMMQFWFTPPAAKKILDMKDKEITSYATRRGADIDSLCIEFSQTIQNALKSQYANEISKLPHLVTELERRVTELERLHRIHPQDTDPLLTKERFLEILREEDLTPFRWLRNGSISVKHTGWGGRTRTINFSGDSLKYKNKSGLAQQTIWLCTNIYDRDIFTNAKIPNHDLDFNGRFYTTESVHESTLRKVIAELYK